MKRLLPIETMTIPKKNVLADTDFPFAERFRDKANPLWAYKDIVVERIVTHGEGSSEGFWRTSPTDYWILLVNGGAVLDIDGEILTLEPGDSVPIKAGIKHRAVSTASHETTVILVVRPLK